MLRIDCGSVLMCMYTYKSTDIEYVIYKIRAEGFALINEHIRDRVICNKSKFTIYCKQKPNEFVLDFRPKQYP